MAKQVIWSPLAKESLKALLLSTLEREGDKRSCRTFYARLQDALYRITLNPFIGQATEAGNIRYISPQPDYTLFYRHSFAKIEVLVLWDNHRKPGRIKAL